VAGSGWRSTNAASPRFGVSRRAPVAVADPAALD
jgi:hypothetical protein